jgi:cyclase
MVRNVTEVEGFEIALTRLIAEHVGVPVVASGGAGTPQHLADVFLQSHADAAIIAGMIHTGDYTIRQIKQALATANIPVRLVW